MHVYKIPPTSWVGSEMGPFILTLASLELSTQPRLASNLQQSCLCISAGITDLARAGLLSYAAGLHSIFILMKLTTCKVKPPFLGRHLSGSSIAKETWKTVSLQTAAVDNVFRLFHART